MGVVAPIKLKLSARDILPCRRQVLVASLSWTSADDLDLHMLLPGCGQVVLRALNRQTAMIIGVRWPGNQLQAQDGGRW